MDIKKEIEQIKNKLAELETSVAKEESEQKPLRWKPENGEIYFHVTDYGVCQSTWLDTHEACKYRWLHNNVFKTRKEAEEHERLSDLKAKFRLLAEESEARVGGFDWKDTEQEKWCAYYDYACEWVRFSRAHVNKHMGQIYFASREDLQAAIDEIGKKNIIEIVKRGL